MNTTVGQGVLTLAWTLVVMWGGAYLGQFISKQAWYFLPLGLTCFLVWFFIVVWILSWRRKC